MRFIPNKFEQPLQGIRSTIQVKEENREENIRKLIKESTNIKGAY